MVFIGLVVTEGFRALTMHYMSNAHNSLDVAEQSILSKLADSRSSIIDRVLEFYSSLLAGENDRLWIIIGYRGCNSLENWIELYPVSYTHLTLPTKRIV